MLAGFSFPSRPPKVPLRVLVSGFCYKIIYLNCSDDKLTRSCFSMLQISETDINWPESTFRIIFPPKFQNLRYSPFLCFSRIMAAIITNNKTLMNPQEYCQEKAAKSGSSFYYSFRFLPESQRHAIIALYAFCREVDDVVDEITEPSVARAKLQWWREEIHRLYHERPTHPVTKALQVHLKTFDLAEEHFYEIIDGMTMDLEYDAYPTFRELQLYCYRVASVVGLMSAEIFGYQDRRTLKYAHDLGMAFQLTNILRDVREDALRGRIYLPQDELKQFDVQPEMLLEQKTPANMIRLFRFQKQRAEQFYQKAFEELPEVDRYTQRSGIIMATIYRATLEEIEKDGFKVLEHRIKLTPLRKLWLAWQTARQEKKRYLQLQRIKSGKPMKP